MMFFDTFVRFAGIGLLLCLAIITLRDVKRSRGSLFLVLSCITTAALLIGFTPIFLPPPEPLLIVARFLDIPHLIFVWLFALSLFDSEFKPRLYHGVVALAYCLPILLFRLSQFGLIGPLPYWVATSVSIGAFLITSHLIWSTLNGRADDLVTHRRAARYYFVCVIGFVAIASALSDMFLMGDRQQFLPTAKALIFLPAIIFACYWLFRIDPSALSFGSRAPEGQGPINASDSTLVQKLSLEMSEGRVFLNPDLTITSLAKTLGVSPTKLREVINTILGHKNFSTYVNRYRIDAIKAALADPNNAGKPILTLALAHGFNSLSPFNRAFLNLEGVTPTEYKRTLKRP